MTDDQQVALKLALDWAEKLNKHIVAGHTVMYASRRVTRRINIDAQSGFIGFAHGPEIRTLFDEEFLSSSEDVSGAFAGFEVFQKMDWK